MEKALKLHQVSRPLLLVALVAAACNVMAADRIDLDKQVVTAAKTLTGDTTTTYGALGLSASEIQEVRSQRYANGKVVTRFEQLHQGVPVWGEAIVQHTAPGQTQASFSGSMLRNVAQTCSNLFKSAKRGPDTTKQACCSKLRNVAQLFVTDFC